MSDAMNMSSPITRGELRTELQIFERKIEDRLATLATKAELESRLAELPTRAELESRFAELPTKAHLDIWGGALLARMMSKIAQLARSVQESSSTHISVIDEKYADLPGRVSRLEEEAFTRRRR